MGDGGWVREVVEETVVSSCWLGKWPGGRDGFRGSNSGLTLADDY